MIAGHTHHPMFESKCYQELITTAITNLETNLSFLQVNSSQYNLAKAELTELQNHLHWVIEENIGMKLNVGLIPKPLYFNAGCCSFGNRVVTGIEIEEDQLRLVQWSVCGSKPQRKVLGSADLKQVFSSI